MARQERHKPVESWDFAEIIVTVPIAPVADKSMMHMLVAYLAQRFPEEDIEVAPGEGCQVIPMAGIVAPGGITAPLEMPDSERLDEISQAVFEFRKAARRLERNDRREA